MSTADDDDPIRELLAEVSPTMFLGNPSGTVAIMLDRILDADEDADPDEIRAWVLAHDGYQDKSFPVSQRHGLSPKPRAASKVFYVIPEDALKEG